MSYWVPFTRGPRLFKVKMLVYNSREGPGAWVEDGREWEQDAGEPDDEQEDPGASLRHPGLQGTDDSDVPVEKVGQHGRESAWSQ